MSGINKATTGEWLSYKGDPNRVISGAKITVFFYIPKKNEK